MSAKSEMFKQLEEVIKRERVYLNAKLRTEKHKSDMYINLDWKEVLDKPKPTEKERVSYITIDENYVSLKEKEVNAKLKYDYERKKLDIMILEVDK